MPIIILSSNNTNETGENWLNYQEQLQTVAAQRTAPPSKQVEQKVVVSNTVSPVSSNGSGVHLVSNKPHLIRRSQYLHDMLTS